MIIDAGITETNGKQHCYTHDRLPDFWVCGVSFKGKMWRRANGKEEISTAPGISYSRPGVRYEIATVAPHNYYSIYAVFMPRPGWRTILQFPESTPGHGRIALENHPYRGEIFSAFREMYTWTRTFLPNSKELAMNALERAFLLATNTGTDSTSTMDERLKEVNNHILNNIDQQLSVDELAETANLSPSRFAHLFKDVFGCTPMQYVERVRMEEAKSLLLNSNLAVYDIAMKTGYENQFHFSMRFKRHVGMSPLAFRKNPKRQ